VEKKIRTTISFFYSFIKKQNKKNTFSLDGDSDNIMEKVKWRGKIEIAYCTD